MRDDEVHGLRRLTPAFKIIRTTARQVNSRLPLTAAAVRSPPWRRPTPDGHNSTR